MTFNFNIHGITPDDVNTNTGGGSASVIETLSPKNTAGLCLWLDGQCNTRQGNDHTKTYMENLVWNIPLTQTNGNLEILHSNSVWNGDFLTLKTWALYPYVYNRDVTVEALVMLDDDFFSADVDAVSIFMAAYTSGYCLQMVKAEGFKFQGYTNGAYVIVLDENPVEANTPYYIVGTIKSNGQITFKNLTKSFESSLDFNGVLTSKSGVNTGVGTNSSLNNTLNLERWKGLNLGMLRLWNRALTDSEIQQNYKDAQKRFNF